MLGDNRFSIPRTGTVLRKAVSDDFDEPTSSTYTWQALSVKLAFLTTVDELKSKSFLSETFLSKHK